MSFLEVSRPSRTQAVKAVQILKTGRRRYVTQSFRVRLVAKYQQTGKHLQTAAGSEVRTGSAADDRSPLDRFRKPPKKTLSVTDFVAPAWCEVQYFYALSKHGRLKATPAMRQGTVVHKELQDEVYTTVPIDTTTKEEVWALKIWNVCQDLYTLRETGRTRELEIWGSIGGEVVAGVIDELTYENPNPKHGESSETRGMPLSQLPEYQSSIKEYLLGKPSREDRTADPEPTLSDRSSDKSVYIVDVKTRNSPTLPSGSSLRPTVLQLHLYHHLLENMAQGNFALQQIADRHRLDVRATFSDAFLAQLGNINQDNVEESSGQESQGVQRHDGTTTSPRDSLDVLLQHNSLTTLWGFMVDQFQRTFLIEPPPSLTPQETPTLSQQSTSNIPPPSLQPTRLSPLLTAEYLAGNYKHVAGTTKKVLGRKTFQFDADFLRAYLDDSLKLWRGQRKAKGVELEDAWKCRTCAYRDDCEWIHERDQAAFAEALERKRLREVVTGQEDGTSKSQV